jgi:hypothetical protein
MGLLRRQIVDDVNAFWLYIGHFLRFMVDPVIVGKLADAVVLEDFSCVGRVTDIFVCSCRVCPGILKQKFFTSRMILLIFSHIVDMIPDSDPKVGFGGMLCDLVEAVNTVGHVEIAEAGDRPWTSTSSDGIGIYFRVR